MHYSSVRLIQKIPLVNFIVKVDSLSKINFKHLLHFILAHFVIQLFYYCKNNLDTRHKTNIEIV